jgi:hypothetical protein
MMTFKMANGDTMMDVHKVYGVVQLTLTSLITHEEVSIPLGPLELLKIAEYVDDVLAE